LNDAERDCLQRVLRFAGWLQQDGKHFRELHQAAGVLQRAADSGVALRDALYALEVSEQELPASSIVTLLRRSTQELHDHFESSGLYASDEPSLERP
jgi:hypothetical protein